MEPEVGLEGGVVWGGALEGPHRMGSTCARGSRLGRRSPEWGWGMGGALGCGVRSCGEAGWTTSNGRGKGSACASKVEKHRV